MKKVVWGVIALSLLFVGTAQAQIPLPSGPVVFCGSQALPNADTYTVVVDGGAAVPLTMSATMDARCPAGNTHSFTLPANQFPLGDHTVRVTGANAFGSTAGVTYTVRVGIAPGQFTITAVLPPAPGI